MLQVRDRIIEPAYRDIAVAAVAVHAGIAGMPLDAASEDLDRIAVASEVGEPPAEPDDAVGVLGRMVVRSLRGGEVRFQPFTRVAGRFGPDQRLAEQRYRFDIRQLDLGPGGLIAAVRAAPATGGGQCDAGSDPERGSVAALHDDSRAAGCSFAAQRPL